MEELICYRDELREARQAKAAGFVAQSVVSPPPVTSPPVHAPETDGADPQSFSPPNFGMPLASPVLFSQPASVGRMPTLAELGKQAKDTFSFPVDPSPKELRQKAMATRFPFDSVTESSIKPKNTPIELWWNLQEGSSPVRSPKWGTNSVPAFHKGVGAIDDPQVGLSH